MMEFHQAICLLSILAPAIRINQHQYLPNRNHPLLDKNDVFTSDLATRIASSVCCDPMQVAVGLGKSQERDVRVGGRSRLQSATSQPPRNSQKDGIRSFKE